jgi:hypothetical protein
VKLLFLKIYNVQHSNQHNNFIYSSKIINFQSPYKIIEKVQNKVVEVFEKWTFLKCPKLKKGRSLFFRKNEKIDFAVKCCKNIKIRFSNNA